MFIHISISNTLCTVSRRAQRKACISQRKNFTASRLQRCSSVERSRFWRTAALLTLTLDIKVNAKDLNLKATLSTLSSRRVEAKKMASRTPTLAIRPLTINSTNQNWLVLGLQQRRLKIYLFGLCWTPSDAVAAFRWVWLPLQMSLLPWLTYLVGQPAWRYKIQWNTVLKYSFSWLQ